MESAVNESAHPVTDGVLKTDAGALFGKMPKTRWSRLAKPDRKHRVALDLNVLLLRKENGRGILIDAGLGPRDAPALDQDLLGASPSRLLQSLKRVGIRRHEIDAVALTHFHYAHVGGLFSLDYNGDMTLTFPKAVCYAQRAAWADAWNPGPLSEGMYDRSGLEALQRRGRLELLDGDGPVLPGVEAIATGGHCPGHQVLLCHTVDGSYLCLGDLAPTRHHWEQGIVSAHNLDLGAVDDAMRQLAAEARKRGWQPVFAHGVGEGSRPAALPAAIATNGLATPPPARNGRRESYSLAEAAELVVK